MKHYHPKIAGSFLMAAFLFLVLSCEQPELLEKQPDSNAGQNTVLDKKQKANPFTAENMKQALKNVLARQPAKSGRTECWECGVPSTTHNYVRFAPQDVDQLITLHNYGYDLYDVPLDQEVTTQGEYYQDPSLPADAITYQYTLVPDNYNLPTTVPYTIISQVFLFDETAGDEADAWIPEPDPGSGYCYEANGAAYICGSNPRTYLRVSGKLPEDLYKKATRTLIEAGIDLPELYNEAMRLAGREDEMIVASKNGRTQSYRPSGTVQVIDNVTNLTVPVKNVTVKLRRFFKLDDVVTDANGNWTARRVYVKKANVVLKFQNNGMKIRGISGALKLWEYAQILEKECGLYTEGQLQGLTITLQYEPTADTYAALQWAAAHCMNTYHEAKAYSVTNSIIEPYYGMNVWISSSWLSSASAPMVRAIIHDPINLLNVLNFLLAPSPASKLTILRKLLTNWAPDVTLQLRDANTGVTRNADNLSNTFFHEFGHSQHYSQVGNLYWAQEIIYTVNNGGYGNKTTSGSGRAAVVESWGFFIGNTFNETKYRAVGTPNAIARANQDLFGLENQIPNDNDWRGWIPFGAIHDMRDVGEPGFTTVIDNVSGYSIQGLFSAYQPGVTTVQGLRQEILNRNGNSQAAQVNQLITSYRW